MRSPPDTWTALSPVNIGAYLSLALVYAGVGAAAQIAFPGWASSAMSPMDLALWIALAAGFAGSFTGLIANAREKVSEPHLPIGAGAIAAILVSELSGWFADKGQLWNSGSFQIAEGVFNAVLAVVVAAALFVLAKLPRKHVWAARSLQALVVFEAFALVSEAAEGGQAFGLAFPSGIKFLAQFAEILCIAFYIISLAFSHAAIAGELTSPTFSGRSNGRISGLFVGSNARQICEECNLIRSQRYPPVAISYYPVFREATVFLVMFWLMLTAGRSLSKATGKTLTSQIVEMTGLWFKNGIDPPSYYAQDFYKAARLRDVRHYLTRFETKNGLLGALNKLTPNPFLVNEMSDKAFFAECCEKFCIPHPKKLLTVNVDTVELHGHPDDLATSLFCKPQKGIGAKHTMTFRYVSPGRYADKDDQQFDLEGVIAVLKRASSVRPMLVQPWLENHPSISDLALDSLITIRVVTCINEQQKPEVALAMLRLLSILEPHWQHLPDGEYAAPIDLVSGEMGLFTGDNFKTAHLRYERHPVTDAPIKGRVLSEWDAIRKTAISTHAAFPHRVIIGWDIALTNIGPVVLEGNSNLDVMFLQRVHDMPAGQTRFGELMNLHLKTLYQRMKLPERI